VLRSHAWFCYSYLLFHMKCVLCWLCSVKMLREMYSCSCINKVSCTSCEVCQSLSSLLFIACVFFSDGFVLSSRQSWVCWLRRPMDWNASTNASNIITWMTAQMDLCGNWWQLLLLVSCQAVSVGKLITLHYLCSISFFPLALVLIHLYFPASGLQFFGPALQCVVCSLCHT